MKTNREARDPQEAWVHAKFEQVGAQFQYDWRRRPAEGAYNLHLAAHTAPNCYELTLNVRTVRPEVIDLRPKERHLLLLVRDRRDNSKSKFLCGFDERHWFIAAIPEAVRGVTNVATAKEALKPEAVHAAQARYRVAGDDRGLRRNGAYIRQGEWFFVPAPGFVPAAKQVLKDEPISRGTGSKPHRCEFLVREGGETVYVSRRFPSGLSEGEYRALVARDNGAKYERWQVMRRNAVTSVLGRITHPDHATVALRTWHRVLMNTESEARAARRMTFLD